MPELDHPPWCVPAFCNIDRPPLNGHQIGAHRSTPQVVESTVLRLRQTLTEVVPSLEVRRGDVILVVPLLEAQALPAAVDDLLEGSGVGL